MNKTGMRSKDLEMKETLALILFGISILLAVFFDLINFVFLSQALTLLNSNSNLLYWFFRGHIHAVRLLVSYPGYLLSIWCNIGLDDGFTIYIAVIFWILYWFVIKILKILETDDKALLISGIFLFCLAVVMNGRIIFAYLGLTMLIYKDIRNLKGRRIPLWRTVMITVISFILGTVSSGTMMVIVAYILLMTVVKLTYLYSPKKCLVVILWGIIGLWLSSTLFYSVFNYLLTMINKNITFFGDGFSGVVNMLNHGIGRYIYLSDSRYYFLYLIIGFSGLTVNFLVFKLLILDRRQINIPLFIAVNLGLYGSLVGLSTGTMLLIPAMILVLSGMKAKNITRIGFEEKSGTGVYCLKNERQAPKCEHSKDRRLYL